MITLVGYVSSKLYKNYLGLRSDTDAGSHLEGQHPLDLGRGHIKGVVAYSKGFAAAVEGGCTILYEKIEDTGFYKRTKEIRVSCHFPPVSYNYYLKAF